MSIVEPAESPEWHARIEGPTGFTVTLTFSGPAETDPRFVAAAIAHAIGGSEHIAIRTLRIDGFGPFQSSEFAPGQLEVIVGANGSGKTSLFELLRAIREFCRNEIPPEIIPGWETREVYHRPGPDHLGWQLTLHAGEFAFFFAADILGPLGTPSISRETLQVNLGQGTPPLARLERRGQTGWLYDDGGKIEIKNQRINQLAVRSYVGPAQATLYRLREEIASWRFFSGIRFDDRQVRQPALTERAPSLREDAGNIAAVLNWIHNDYRDVFNELEIHIRGLIPAFRGLGLRATGSGRVTLTWDEDGLVNPLTASDLSDGSLRLILWLTLALTPNPPALVCIDEPEVGMHPRTLPKIAGLLKKLATRTQVIVATHSSYFLTQFDVSNIAVLRKRNGNVEFAKPATSQALLENLREFGSDELELMHRSDELEAFA